MRIISGYYTCYATPMVTVLNIAPTHLRRKEVYSQTIIDVKISRNDQLQLYTDIFHHPKARLYPQDIQSCPTNRWRHTGVNRK